MLDYNRLYCTRYVLVGNNHAGMQNEQVSNSEYFKQTDWACTLTNCVRSLLYLPRFCLWKKYIIKNRKKTAILIINRCQWYTFFFLSMK